MITLGIHAFTHDSTAALAIDGRLVAFAHEERLSRIKNDPAFPARAIRFVLDHPADVRLDIVSAGGERVRQFALGNAATGAHDVHWRGESDRGGTAASGVYFCRLIVDGTAVDASRLVLVK